MDLVLLGTTGTVLGRKTMHLPGATLVGAITVDYNTCVRRCGVCTSTMGSRFVCVVAAGTVSSLPRTRLVQWWR